MRFLCFLVGLIGLAGTGIGAPTESHSVNVRDLDAQGIDVHNIDSNGISANDLPLPIPVANIYVCAEQTSTGCKLINAHNLCLPFGSDFAYKSNYVRQAKGTYCVYYTKTGCMDGDVYFRYTSFPKLEAEFTGWGVKTLAGIFCAGTGQTLDVPGDEAHAVASRDTGLLSVSASDSEEAKLDSVDALGKVPGDTTICHGLNFTYCNDNRINAIQQCANFDSIDIGPASLIQYPGAYCKWYSDFGCNDKTLVGAIDSMHSAVAIADLREYTNQFFSVKCEAHAW
ncbi:hypothetical protein PtrSN002B_001720 [Pyrenophora tritici-repentis]|uniref:Uncharacterized protein n=2 Tax=Pyrenophora tritici-repentis TaxID=45151 RepID=A0A2W1G3U2_9PLEO|nr:uncharacterized protein PTRG_11595 [Pyrenophora tritici-repentis Pt-1C-BFP]KAA8627106.1 hypothetical protein PtrV1_02786 [Pyrenophora tritici-repentis]EDU44645.1 predicted protein [Pyrenophora tritici-repentis Pt-1C-BFP]KAF7455538.1 hypothetical protein A1F99_027960 [Pyrenophora tritici-repentis]KAF7578742.1 hypothetical protein PtrM4_029820 [Pyrenophora tritici-repentis]KAG9389289.1 hypothetical protein A1F94_002182 [Pyrenophora tritici-repentis]